MATHSDAFEAARRKEAQTGAVGPGHPAMLLSAAVLALVLLGLVMILSASSVSSFAKYGSSFLFFKRQLVWAAVGVAGFLVCARTDYRVWRRLAYPGFLAALLLLLLVEVPGFGVVAGGSARWLQLGPLSFQPSELAKLALVLFAAEALSRKEERHLEDFMHTVIPVVPAFGCMGLLVMAQPDMGTTLVLASITMGMLFVAGAPMRYLLPMAGGGVALATFLALSEPYRRERMLAFMNPWADPLNTGYQTIQSLYALGSGGLLGVGLGASRQKWSYIPNSHTDFIFSILGEELGLLGTLLVLALFALIAYLGIRTAGKAPDRFGMLVAAGTTVWISLQALINVGAVSASLPVTGVPLPLVSFGGTSLVITLVALGIAVNIALRGHERTGRTKQGRSATGES
ncbi:MAG TPA: putative lipid II flippase FtsW [Actinomycetota bacterium]|jgi:cell division protein FtsW|nr:putative lipid II flippase FtsW [Actinomycetota bacterium]